MARAEERLQLPSPPIRIIISPVYTPPPPPSPPNSFIIVPPTYSPPPPPPYLPPLPPPPPYLLPLPPSSSLPPPASVTHSRHFAKLFILIALAVAFGLYSVTVVIWILYKLCGWWYSSRQMNVDWETQRTASVQMV
ncbi:extensin-like [Lathyrus oleraceus]|uniref:extensin-like n=1 Tax=Pisum sativum TaxID=3888 RepID=UPI0021CE9B27|nr:extensin-like [Pisum sativum]